MNTAKVFAMSEIRNAQNDPLNLRSLPPVTSGRDGWPAIEAALLQESRKRKAWRFAGGALAAAATVVLAVSIAIRPAAAPAPGAAPGEGLSAEPRTGAGTEVQSAPLREPTLESLIALSQGLEDRVRQYRARVGDLPSDALVYQVELQDLVAQVDGELSLDPASSELWSQRVNLLLDLARLYENSLRRDYHRMASL